MNVMQPLYVYMERYSTGYKCLGLTLFVGKSSRGVKYIGLVDIQIFLRDSNTNTFKCKRIYIQIHCNIFQVIFQIFFE